MDSVLNSLLITKWITVDSRDTAPLSLVIIPFRNGHPVQQYRDPKALSDLERPKIYGSLTVKSTNCVLHWISSAVLKWRPFSWTVAAGKSHWAKLVNRAGEGVKGVWNDGRPGAARKRVIENNLRCYSVFCSFRSLRRYFSGACVWIPSIEETYEVVLTFESVVEILWCYRSNETSSAVLSYGTIYLVCSSNFWVCGWNPMVWPFKWNLFSSTFTWCYVFRM